MPTGMDYPARVRMNESDDIIRMKAIDDDIEEAWPRFMNSNIEKTNHLFFPVEVHPGDAGGGTQNGEAQALKMGSDGGSEAECS